MDFIILTKRYILFKNKQCLILIIYKIMELIIKSLGPIKNSKIDLDKNLIVLTGPNSTGKSYLSYLLYGIFNINKEKYSRKFYGVSEFQSRINLNIKKKNIEVFEKKNRREHIIDIDRTFYENYSILLDLFNKELKGLVVKFYSSYIDGANFYLRLPIIKYHYKKTEYIKLLLRGNRINTIRKDGRMQSFTTIKKSEISLNVLYDNLSLIMSYDFLNSLCFSKYNVFFLPAERTGLNLFAPEITKQKSLDRDLIAQKILEGEDIDQVLISMRKIKRRIIPRYPLSLSDYIYFINDIPTSNKITTKYSNLANDIEKKILNGKILITKYNEIVFVPDDYKKNLVLHMSSSLVKSLMGLILYLRFFATENALIIIDEPELNLHPLNQIIFTRIIAQIVNSGLKIILSTHSDYILREFSNLITLGNNKNINKFKSIYKYNKNEFLNSRDVSILLFENKNIKTIDPTNVGFQVLHINKVINQQNLITNDIIETFLN
jgi:hypothetical protein